MNETHVRRTDHDDVVVLTACGDFDLSCVEVLRTAFVGAFADQPRVILDLGEVTFADSTALSVMVAASKRAAAGNGWLRLAGPRSNVSRILQITALDTVVEVYPSVAEALRSSTGNMADGQLS